MRASLLFILVLTSCQSQSNPPSISKNYKFETLVERKNVVWGFDFLPDGRILFTEREGKMLTFDPLSKQTQELKGLPKIYVAGQGGLLDVRVHPEFKKNNIIYFVYSEPVGNGSTTALAMARLKGAELNEVKKLFSGFQPNENDIHYGSRIEFDKQGHLFFSMGDRDERNHAQSLAYHQGKVLRLNLDGSVPKDNPFVKNKEAKPEIWSLGHRSPQGLVIHPETQQLWEAEMGPRGGDEINLIEAGKNYGWPEITYGREYYGPKIGAKEKKGMEQPIEYWVPSISPSAITFYTGDKFPQWKNNMFMGNLSGTHVRRLVLEGRKVKEQEEMLAELEYRWRNLRTGPDGYLYLSTDEGKIGRIILK